MPPVARVIPSDFPNSPKSSSYDAIVVGSGPNGLAAAIELARKGASVLVIEAKKTPGGGMRTEELTLPGFAHDVCSSVHPMANASPFFQSLDLEKHGLAWKHPEFPVAHPFDGGRAITGARSVKDTAAGLGEDEKGYSELFQPLVDEAAKLNEALLGPFTFPKYPGLLARFGTNAIRSAVSLANARFKTPEARALFAGHAAHSVQPLENTATAAFGLMLAIASHQVGWPVAAGGSRSIAAALVSELEKLGGEVNCGHCVGTIEELPKAKVYLFDTSPAALASICRTRLPDRYIKKLKAFRHGPAVFKVDWALSDPIPWTADDCRKAATVHVGGTIEEIAESEREAWQGHHSSNPFLILTQPSLFDPSRAPANQHTAWAYCHVPNGSTMDMLDRIESQVERFAPGFRDSILERHTMSACDMEANNPNYVGGDIVGGIQDLRQLYTRPVARMDPYTTPAKNVFICSASTPPGGGVHGMCGFHAAKSALKLIH